MRVHAGSVQGSRTLVIGPNRANPAPLRQPRARARLDGTHAAIVFSAFLVLFAATLLIGGHAAIDPMLQSAAEVRDFRNSGDIVYTMPDGKFCRHVSYDNETGEQTGGNIRPCDNDIVARNLGRSSRHFTWQTN